MQDTPPGLDQADMAVSYENSPTWLVSYDRKFADMACELGWDPIGCYGVSPSAIRAFVAPLKMGLRRITYLVSVDQTNADIFELWLRPVTQTMVLSEGLPWNHPTFLVIKKSESNMFLGDCNLFFSNVFKFKLKSWSISWYSSLIYSARS